MRDKERPFWDALSHEKPLSYCPPSLLNKRPVMLVLIHSGQSWNSFRSSHFSIFLLEPIELVYKHKAVCHRKGKELKKKEQKNPNPVICFGLFFFPPFSSNKCLFCAAEIGTTPHPFQKRYCFMNSWKTVILYSNLQIWSSDKQRSLKEHQLAQAVVLVVIEVSQTLGDFNTICSTNSLILSSCKKKKFQFKNKSFVMGSRKCMVWEDWEAIYYTGILFTSRVILPW